MKKAAHGLAVGCKAKDSSYALNVRVRAASRSGAIAAVEREPNAQEPHAIPDVLPVTALIQGEAQAAIPAVPHGTRDEPQVRAEIPAVPHGIQDEPQALHAFRGGPAEKALQPTSSRACFPAVPQVRCDLPDALRQPAHGPHHAPQDERRHQWASPRLRSPDAHGWR